MIKSQDTILFQKEDSRIEDFAELVEGAEFNIADTIYRVVAHEQDSAQLEAIVVGSVKKDDAFSMRVVYQEGIEGAQSEYFFKLVSVGDSLNKTGAGYSQSKRVGNLTLALMSQPRSIDELYRVLASMTREYFGGWIVETYSLAQRVEFSEWEIKLYASDEMRLRYGNIICLCSVTYEAWHSPVQTTVTRLDESLNFVVEASPKDLKHIVESAESILINEPLHELYDMREMGKYLLSVGAFKLYANESMRDFLLSIKNRGKLAEYLEMSYARFTSISFVNDTSLPDNCIEFRDEKTNRRYRCFLSF